jgi:hypothetical protein
MPTQVEVARALGCSQPIVSKWVKRGMPLTSVEDARNWREGRMRSPPVQDRTDPAERKAKVSPAKTIVDDDTMSLPAEQAALAKERRRLLELQADALEGKLVDRAAMTKSFCDAFRTFCSQITAMSNTLTPQVVGIDDEREIDRIIIAEIRATLTRIATQAETICPTVPKV